MSLKQNTIPKYSIIIPVLHETLIINTLIQHLHSLPNPASYEIIVVDGNKEKDTIKSITDTNITTLVSDKGRAKQMNAGAAVAQGEILLFLHVDTHLPKNVFQLIDNTLSKSRFVGGAFTLRIDSKKILLKIIAALSTIRSQFTRIPYGDQVIFLRKNYFEHIGRYKELPLMEDLELMLRIKKAKGKICILTNQVLTSPRRWEQQGSFRTTLLNMLILVLYRIGRVSPDKLRKWHRYPQ